MAVKKIAVLGGGMGSLTAVYKLTSDPDWKSKYDITVYQMGWRLGGKGASGRNGSVINGLSSQRIEEHGLHLWFGFYDNAFRLIQQCYADNNRQPGTPLATWQQAFEGYTTICMEENINGEWLHWPFNVPPNSLTPGQGDAPPRPHDYIHKILDFMKAQHEAYQGKKSPEAITNIQAHAQSEHMGLIKTLLADIVGEAAHLFADAGLFLLHAAIELAKISQHTLLIQVLDKLKEWLVIIIDGLMTKDTELRRIFIMLDLGIVTIKGMIHDKVIKEGFDVINNYDYRDWLVKHGADNLTVNSAIVQGVYGLVFGGNRQYTFEAGTALRGLLRLGLTFKGHVYYRMLAGMGDVIFAPMYQVLQARGVNFQFFHKVSNIGLSPDQSSIASVSFDVQATIKSNYSMYDPLVTVQNLPCWPSTPNYEYLNEGEALQSQQVNLESYYSTWKPVQAGYKVYQYRF